MITKIFTIYDSKAESFMSPFFAPTRGSAIRMFSESIADSNSQFCKYPEDFTLFELGEYDDATGLILPLSTPASIGLAVEFVK